MTMGLFGGNKQVQQSTTVPWGPAQKYLKFGMDQAQGLYNQGAGFKATPFGTVSPFSGATKSALGGIMNTAQQGNPLAGQSMNAISGILGGDINQKYNDLYSQSDNPHFAAAVQNQSDQIANDVQRQFSGLGRIGSAADTGALVDQLGRFREGALSNQWNQNIANQRGILGDQSSGMLNAVGAAPGAYSQQFLPFQQMAQVGAARDQQQQKLLDARTNRFQTNQQAPWNRLNAYNGAIGGGVGAGQTTTQTQPSNPLGSILGGALGGGSLFGIPGAIGGGLLGGLSSLL